MSARKLDGNLSQTEPGAWVVMRGGKTYLDPLLRKNVQSDVGQQNFLNFSAKHVTNRHKQIFNSISLKNWN